MMKKMMKKKMINIDDDKNEQYMIKRMSLNMKKCSNKIF